MDKKKIAISGASGLVGTALSAVLKGKGYQTISLVRSSGQRSTNENSAQAVLNYQTNQFDSAKLEGLHAVVHLAGESIAALRWTPRKKKLIYESRVLGTKFLCEHLRKLQNPPKAFLCASAIGYYGDRGDQILDEDTPSGEGFLAQVVRDWEVACQPAQASGIRTVNMRIGMVLAANGGALQKMLPIFRLGLGGKIGNGKQFVSWISIQDLAAAILFAIEETRLSGALNLVAPHPVTNWEFTKALGQALNRPTIFPLPACAAQLLMGEMADALLLASTRAEPKKLLSAGFAFAYPDLSAALQANCLKH